jgi:hypothetical protein
MNYVLPNRNLKSLYIAVNIEYEEVKTFDDEAEALEYFDDLSPDELEYWMLITPDGTRFQLKTAKPVLERL